MYTVNRASVSVLLAGVSLSAAEGVQEVHKLFGLEGISEGHGILVAVTGLVSVFAALVVITLMIAALPATLRLVSKVFPESHAEQVKSGRRTDDSEVALAAALAFHANQSAGQGGRQ
ncbi:MAG: hypothetical protein ACQEQV_00865 [Fibrobacterota bacterium]